MAAKNNVAEQINARLSGFLEHTIKEWNKKGSQGSHYKYIEKIISRTRIDINFDRPYLMDIVARETHKGSFGALAALDRKRAVAYLGPKVRGEIDTLNIVLKQCGDAYNQGRLKLLRAEYKRALSLAAKADEPFRELCFIGGMAAHYRKKSPWLSLAKVYEKKMKLTNQRRWYVHIDSALSSASPHAGHLEPVVANVLREKKKLQADRVRQPVSGDLLIALRNKLGDDMACLSFAVTGNLRGRVSSVDAGQGNRLHICVCKLDLTGRHVGTGRTLFQLTVSGNNGGGEDDDRACQECVELLQKPLQKELTKKVQSLDL